MKKISVLLCMLLFGTLVTTVSAQSTKKDSLIISFGNNTRILIYGQNRNEIQKILNYDLNRMVADLNSRLDSLDTRKATLTTLTAEIDGAKYLRDPAHAAGDSIVKIDLRGVRVKDGSTEVAITVNGTSDSSIVEISESRSDGSEVTEVRKRYYRSRSPRQGFELNLGLNLYANNTPGGYEEADYALKPVSSRFVSLGIVKSLRMARGKAVGFFIDLGLNFSWFNNMFDSNNTVRKNDLRKEVEFTPLRDPVTNAEIELSKSKLTASYVNLSLMPTLAFRGGVISHISAGAYGGYRLDSYTKTKIAGTKEKKRIHGDYYLNDFRYGLSFEVGIRNFPDLFVNYDINEFFEADRGPGLNMLSFGIRL